MTRLNVRCCCMPVKIMGTLELTDDEIRARGKIVYTPVSVPYIGHMTNIAVPVLFPRAGEEVIQLRHYGPFSELAVYSDDRPIEFWRGVPGFREKDRV